MEFELHNSTRLRTMVNSEDRISMLPDEVLCYILSFLPTEQAVATCLLSKRWKNLWTSVPVLDYDNEPYLEDEKPSSSFVRLVSETIRARDLNQPITRFSLRYDASDCDRAEAYVNAWLKAVMLRPGIEDLDINMYETSFMITVSCCSIFRCKTLVSLSLSDIYVDDVSSVELPSLKYLYLHCVKMKGPKCLIDLLLGCPILEDLDTYMIKYSSDDDGSRFDQEFNSLPKLVCANIRDINYFVFPLKMISNVKFLMIELNPFYNGVLEFPNLIKLDLSFDSINFEDRINWQLVLEMLKNSPKLQVFELSCSRNPGDTVILPDLHLVPECLTSEFRKCSLNLCYGTENEVRFAKYIMQNSTTLQSMTISCQSTHAKHEMLRELALCPRRSVLSELSFKVMCP